MITPFDLMLWTGIAFGVSLLALIINFSMMWGKEFTRRQIFIHLLTGALTAISGLGLVGGFVWWLVLLIRAS